MARMFGMRRDWGTKLPPVCLSVSNHDSLITTLRRRISRHDGRFRYRHAFELRADGLTGLPEKHLDWSGTLMTRIDWVGERVRRCQLRLWSTVAARWSGVCSTHEAGPFNSTPMDRLQHRVSGYEKPEVLKEATCQAYGYGAGLREAEQELVETACHIMFGACVDVPLLTEGRVYPTKLVATGFSVCADCGCTNGHTLDCKIGGRGTRMDERVSFSFDGMFQRSEDDVANSWADLVGRQVRPVQVPTFHQETGATEGVTADELTLGKPCPTCGGHGVHRPGCTTPTLVIDPVPPATEVANEAQKLKRRGLDPQPTVGADSVRGGADSGASADALRTRLTALLNVASESTDGRVRAEVGRLVDIAGVEEDNPVPAVVELFAEEAADALLNKYERITMDAWGRHGDILPEDDHAELWHERLESMLCVLGNYYEDEHVVWEPSHGMMLDERTSGPCLLQVAEEVAPDQNTWPMGCRWLVGLPGRTNPQAMLPSDWAQLTSTTILQQYRPARKRKDS